MFDLSSYMARIGLQGRPTLAELHRAHVAGILFENLDPLVGIPVSLDPDAIARKLVDAGRGGYCFEHNLLFQQVLEQCGAKVEPILARVRNGLPATFTGPLTHLLLRVDYQGAVWHADVGFGQGTLLEPIPFGPGGPYEQSGWSFQVISEGPLLVLQTATDDGWRDLYAFGPEPAPLIDIEVSNWFTCTHPQSRFVTSLLVTEHGPDGGRTTLSDFSGEMMLIEQRPGEPELRETVARELVPELLLERFDLREPEPED
ncbi:MAG TPA: arylamine N-acetyltransferase [Pseudonocardiaceae bacterium]|nr:arylamine N-acetyltransferase [Pseudonocardiaceae bacterium]